MGDVFTAAPQSDVLKLLIEIVVLLFTARVFGEIAQRLGQSSVVGEILAGIVLGPSLLSRLIPFIERWIVPTTRVQGYLLEDISLLGIIFLLLITGLETDLALIRRQARSAVGVAIGGLSLTLTAGFVLGNLLPDDLLVNPDDRVVFALFLAISMAISAIPVVAKVLMDLNLTRRDVGQTIIASAMIDDTTGWILLSVVIAMATGAGATLGAVAESVLSVFGFIIFSFTVGQWLVRRGLWFVQNHVISRDKQLTFIVLLTFAWGAITHALHLEALLGAFVMGILFSRVPSLDSDAIHKLESIALGIFAPIFFAVAGLKVDIVTLLEPRLLGITVLITVVAIVCKVTGVYLGARLIGKRDHWSALFLGSGLNARGSMGIIIATIGLSDGVLTQDTFSMIVVMALVTSLIAPAALRWTMSHIEAEAEELERLQKEEMKRDDIIANTHRVLLPVRFSRLDTITSTQAVEARVLERIGAASPLEVTLFTISPEDASGEADTYLQDVAALFEEQGITRKVVVGGQPEARILEEARKSYDLLVLGASDRSRDSSTLFNPIVDHLIRLAPCPTIVVRGAEIPDDWAPRRILIPTTGSPASRRAAQVGYAVAGAAKGSSLAIILAVVEEHYNEYHFETGTVAPPGRFAIAEQIVGDVREMGKLLGVETVGDVQRGNDTAGVILAAARSENVDLIVLGTNVRAGSGRLYLGPKVEYILNDAPCPVVIVNSG